MRNLSNQKERGVETDSRDSEPIGHLHPPSISVEDQPSRGRLFNLKGSRGSTPAIGAITSGVPERIILENTPRLYGVPRQGGNASLIAPSDASFLTDTTGLDEISDGSVSAIAAQKKNYLSGRPPRRKTSPGEPQINPPLRSLNRNAPAQISLTQTALLRFATPQSVETALPASSSPTAVMSLPASSPQPPIRTASPTPLMKNQQSPVVTPPSGKRSLSPPKHRQKLENVKLPDLKTEKHKSCSEHGSDSQSTRSNAAPLGKPPRIPVSEQHAKPPSLKFTASGDTLKWGNVADLGISDAQDEALQYTMPHPGGKLSLIDSTSSSNNENDDTHMFSSDSRRISSLTFLSHRAPCAPGEHIPEETTDHAVRATFVDEKKAARLGTGASDAKFRDSRMPQYVEDHVILPRASTVNYAGMISTTTPSPSFSNNSATRTNGIVMTSLPSMVTIPEVEVSSIPAPPPSLQRQPELVVPGAWAIPRMFRSFVSARRPPLPEAREMNADDASQASRITIRSLLTATWSLIHPTRRLESVQPNVPMVVKATSVEATKEEEPIMTRKYVLCSLCMFLVVVALLAIILVVLLVQGGPRGSNALQVPAVPMLPNPTTMAPSTSPFLPKPNLPTKPGAVKPRGIDNPSLDSGNGSHIRKKASSVDGGG